MLENVRNEVNVVVSDARVGDKTHPRRRDRSALDTTLGEFSHNLTGLGVIEGHDIGATGRGVIARLGKGGAEEARQLTGSRVIFLQTIDHRVKGHEPGGR